MESSDSAAPQYLPIMFPKFDLLLSYLISTNQVRKENWYETGIYLCKETKPKEKAQQSEEQATEQPTKKAQAPKPGRLFFWVPNIYEFCKIYPRPDVRKARNDYRQTLNQSIYEIIPGERVQKPHFDVDIIYEKVEITPDDAKRLVKLLCYVTGTLIAALTGKSLEEIISRHPIYVSGSEDPANKKFSRHVIINHYRHRNNVEAKAFYESVIDSMLEELYTDDWRLLDYKGVISRDVLTQCVDRRVYGATQQFRMLWSNKMGQTRKKLPMTLVGQLKRSAWMGSDATWLEEIDKSMVSTTDSDSEWIPIKVKPEIVKSKRERTCTERCELSTGEQKDLHELLCKYFGGEIPYNIGHRVGDIVRLDRVESGYCPVCNRDHDKENACLIILGAVVLFRCFRAEKAKFAGILWKFQRLDFIRGLGTDKFEKFVLKEVCEQYCSYSVMEEINPKTEKVYVTILIDSDCGTGKTKIIFEYIANEYKKNRLLRILYVVPRITLAGEKHECLSCKISNGVVSLYRDPKLGTDLTGAQILVCCVCSLHRIHPNAKYDIVVLDEARSTMQQLVQMPLDQKMRENHHLSRLNLQRFMHSAGRRIFLEADVDLGIQYFVSMMHPDDMQDALHYKNTYQARKGHKLKRVSKEALYDLMQKAVNDGKLFNVCCGSKAEAEAIHKRYDSESCPSLLVTSKTKDGHTEVLKRINESIHDYKMLLYTSSMSVGLDISSPWADLSFAYCLPTTSGPHTIYQMLLRTRQVKDKLCFIHVQNYRGNKPITICEIREELRKEVETSIVELEKIRYKLGLSPFEFYNHFDGTSWIVGIYLIMELEKNLALCHFWEILRSIFGKHGFDIDDLLGEKFGDGKELKEVNKAKKLTKEEEIEMLGKAPVLLDWQLEDLKERRNRYEILTLEESMILRKAAILESLNSEYYDEVMYNGDFLYKFESYKSFYWNYMLFRKGETAVMWDSLDLQGSAEEQRRMLVAKFKIARGLCNALGLSDPYEQKQMTEGDIQRARLYITDNAAEIKSAFGMKVIDNQDHRYTTRMINDIFGRLFGNKLVNLRPRKGEKERGNTKKKISQWHNAGNCIEMYEYYGWREYDI